MEKVNLKSVSSHLQEIIIYHKVNVKLGATCAVLAIALLYCLLTNRAMRQKNKLVICLAIADFVNCVGICLMGLDRIYLYNNVLETGQAQQENSWSCALEFWLLIRTIGDVWPPIVQFSMGLDQYLNTCACKRITSKKRQEILVYFTLIFVFLYILIAYTTSYYHRSAGTVKYYCGRKAAFGRFLSGIIYSHNVIGYISGVVLNGLALRKPIAEGYTSSEHREKHRQNIKSCLVVSCISTVLVSIPNSLSLCSLLITSVSDTISKPAVWATCLNSGVNVFVYLVINNDFRSHFVEILTRKSKYQEDSFSSLDHQPRARYYRLALIQPLLSGTILTIE